MKKKRPMIQTTDRYINLFTDYGFKKIFGEEPNKDLLISFLNELLEGKEKIEDLTYLKNEQLGNIKQERNAIYDLYCTNDLGEKFIIEIQRVKQDFFKDRSVYYSTFAIRDQAKKGKEWEYELKNVYTIAILDFVFEDSTDDKFEYHVKLVDTLSNEVFYDKLTFIYLEIPKFNKELHELNSDYERWLYAFRNLHRLKRMPKELEAGIFKRLFELAEIANFDEKEASVYSRSLKDYWDMNSVINSYFREGKEEGKIEIALNALQANLPVETIAQITDLSIEEIEDLKNS